MTSKRYFYLQVGIFVLLVALIIAGTVGGNNILQNQSRKLSALKLESATIEMQQNALIQAKKDIERYNDLDKISRSVVPQDKDQAKTVREIVQIANQNNIPIKSISFETSNLGNAQAGASTAAPGQPSVSQVKPVNGIPGVFTLPIQVESAGSVGYQDFLRFLESLETNRRTAHVDAINLEPSDNGSNLNFNLTLNAYVKP
jgi:hypothetical protein